MPLVACAECNATVSDKATACPHCGHPQTPIEAPTPTPPDTTSSARSWVWWIVGSALAMILLSALFGKNDPRRKDKADARAAINTCWSEQARKSFSPEAAQFVAGACERMEREFRDRFGTNP